MRMVEYERCPKCHGVGRDNKGFSKGSFENGDCIKCYGKGYLDGTELYFTENASKRIL